MSKNTKANKNTKAKKNVKSVYSKCDILYLLPVIFVLAIVPLIVYLNKIPLDSETIKYWTGQKDNNDFFSYTKAFFISIMGMISIVMYFIYRFQKNTPIKPLYGYYAPTGVYAFFIILSAALSTHPITAKSGYADRYEGVYVLLSYLILLVVTIAIVNQESHAKIMITALLVSAVAIGTIGIFQFFDHDLFRSSFGKSLIIPAIYKQYLESIDFNFGKFTIYSTLYNTNFVGSYMAMLFPLSLTLFILVKDKIPKIIIGLVTLLMFANLIGCRSRAGLVGTVIALIVLVIILRKKFIPNIVYTLAVIIACSVIFIIMNKYTNGDLLGRLKAELASVGNENKGIYALLDKYSNSENGSSLLFNYDGTAEKPIKKANTMNSGITAVKSEKAPAIKFMDMPSSLKKQASNTDIKTGVLQTSYMGTATAPATTAPAAVAAPTTAASAVVPPVSSKDPYYMRDIIFSDKSVSIITLQKNLNIKLENNQIGFYDAEGKALDINKDESGNITFKDAGYSAYRFSIDMKNNILNVYYGDKNFSFFIHQTGFKMIEEKGIILDDIKKPESVFFAGREKLGSSRGYIWSRSIPLLKKYIFAGSGPDNYAFVFPQHDYVGKLNAFGTVNEIVDKPHNMYLQIGINTGVVSLLAVLALFGFYLITCIRLYFKGNFENHFAIIGGAIFTAIVGYLGAACFNDSLVSVAPVFWILLGLGICCNYMITDKKVRA